MPPFGFPGSSTSKPKPKPRLPAGELKLVQIKSYDELQALKEKLHTMDDKALGLALMEYGVGLDQTVRDARNTK